MDQATDEQLMFEYKQGKLEAIEMIYGRYKMKIFNFCYRFLGNRADAEDAASEVFTTLFANKYNFDPKAKFSTWLFTVAHNHCISQIRKRKGAVSFWFKSKNQEEQHYDVVDPTSSSRDDLLEKERSQIVKDAIGQLPLEQKEAILLREYHELSYEEIAKVLGCSLEKVKILIFRARENLRGSLQSLNREANEDMT